MYRDSLKMLWFGHKYLRWLRRWWRLWKMVPNQRKLFKGTGNMLLKGILAPWPLPFSYCYLTWGTSPPPRAFLPRVLCCHKHKQLKASIDWELKKPFLPIADLSQGFVPALASRACKPCTRSLPFLRKCPGLLTYKKVTLHVKQNRAKCIHYC